MTIRATHLDADWLGIVRHTAEGLAAARLQVTWPTLDGEVTVDYRPGDFLRVVFTGDGPERVHVLHPAALEIG